jgi:hypothetical protein
MPVISGQRLTPHIPTENNFPLNRQSFLDVPMFSMGIHKTTMGYFTAAQQSSFWPTSGQRKFLCPSVTDTAGRQTSRPEIVFLSGIVFLGHEGFHSEYTQARGFHRRSATVVPIDFRSTTIDAHQLRVPRDVKNSNRKSYFSSMEDFSWFSNVLIDNMQEAELFTAAQRRSVPSNSGERQSMPVSIVHRLTP